MHIGIDLGTSNSVIAGIVDGEARVFHPADGGEVLPSVIYIDKRGHRLYGRRAHDQALVSPENVASGFKRLMGTSTPITVKGAEVTLTPEECSAEIIRQLLGQVTTETGEENFDGAIITIPAAFNQMQSEATLRAARMAGLERVDLIQEPIAAALAAMAGAKRSGQFLIYDLGGGTFDVALAQAIEGNVSIVAHQGINMLGGRDFDRMIVNEIVRPWLVANFDLPDNFQRDPQYARLIRIAQLAAEKAKIDLSSLEEASIFASDDEVRLMDQNESEIFLDAPITRAQFEEIIREPVMHTIDMVRKLLESNNYSNDDIDRIVFIGGPSRIPMVREMVSEELGIAPDLRTDPMTAVAMGAAHYCEGREWDKAKVKDFKPAASPAAVGGGSSPKPKHASVSVPYQATAEVKPAAKTGAAAAAGTAGFGVTFDYDRRTTAEKTVLALHITGKAKDDNQVRIFADGWDSGVLPLVDGLTVVVPLRSMGENRFRSQVLDASGKPIDGYDGDITVTRVVAMVGNIPAAQTIAVKVLENPHSRENALMTLVAKGSPLPAEGHVRFTSGRTLRSGGAGYVGVELFQVEFPERVDLNLCIGMFRIDGYDLPSGAEIKAGDPISFDWNMSDGGILQATVTLPKIGLELRAPRFYAPQSGQVSFSGEEGNAFASSVLDRGDEEWGDLAAALGPDGGPEAQMLHSRLLEQRDVLSEAAGDAETVRRVVEEARFVRQDIARLGRKHIVRTLQRRLGKLVAVFNRVARSSAEQEEEARFEELEGAVQRIIDDGDAAACDDAAIYLSEMRNLFFGVVWRDDDYIATWFKRLCGEPYLFTDKEVFAAMVEEGEALLAKGDRPAMRDLVARMLDARIALGVNDMAGELATIVKA